MNRVRQLCAITLLIMLLAASSTMAGQIPYGVTSPPPPTTETSATGDMPQGATSSETSVTGDMPYGDTSEIDPVTGLALSLLKSLLSLF
jgi:hypothetical protein